MQALVMWYGNFQLTIIIMALVKVLIVTLTFSKKNPVVIFPTEILQSDEMGFFCPHLKCSLLHHWILSRSPPPYANVTSHNLTLKSYSIM